VSIKRHVGHASVAEELIQNSCLICPVRCLSTLVQISKNGWTKSERVQHILSLCQQSRYDTQALDKCPPHEPTSDCLLSPELNVSVGKGLSSLPQAWRHAPRPEASESAHRWLKSMPENCWFGPGACFQYTCQELYTWGMLLACDSLKLRWGLHCH
jgi:hypothetical protein